MLSAKANMIDADMIEWFVDHLITKHEHWLFEFALTENDTMTTKGAAIGEFVDWVRKESQRELHVKRGRENTSYLERREMFKNQQSGEPNESSGV